MNFFKKYLQNLAEKNNKNITLNLPRKLSKSIKKNAGLQKISVEAYITKILEKNVISSEFLKPFVIEKNLLKLEAYLNKIPGVSVVSFGESSRRWWIKLVIDIKHQFAWYIIQELGFVLNNISISQNLPTVFKPTSPPPYLNGSPEDYLSWVIESLADYQDPACIALILEDRLPHPVEDEKSWKNIQENEEI